MHSLRLSAVPEGPTGALLSREDATMSCGPPAGAADDRTGSLPHARTPWDGPCQPPCSYAMADVLDLPFDQYQRYALVGALLESVRAPGETFQVLDVGGRTALLREFLPMDRVQLVDVDPSDVDGLVLGSGAELPFQSDSVDVVAAFDTLEHVPPALRDAFVAECARVARRYVILAGPYDSPRVAEAEEILLAFLRDRLDWTHRYLEEHRINGLPDAGATRAVLEAAGAKVEVLGHGALDRWLLLMCLELYAEHEPMLRELAGRAYRLYNEHLFRSDHGDDVYRHAMVAVFGDAPVPHLRDALDAPGSAPAGATEVFRELGQELLRYDALRDSYAPEMERLHGVVAALKKDRDEHAESLAVQGEDLEESRKSLQTLQGDLVETRKSYETVLADLEGSRSTIEALQSEAERERGEIAKVLADLQTRLGAVEADLEGHRTTLAEVQGLREAELAELDKRGQMLTEQNGRLAEQSDLLAEQNDRIASLDGEIASARELLQAALVEGSTAEPSPRIGGGDLTLDEELLRLVQLRDRLRAERDGAHDDLTRIRRSIWGLIGQALRLMPKS